MCIVPEPQGASIALIAPLIAPLIGRRWTARPLIAPNCLCWPLIASPLVAGGLPGPALVRLALNGVNFDDGTPDPAAYIAQYGVPPVPQSYRYYRQLLHDLLPVGGPTSGGTTVNVRGEGFLGFDGQPSTARCKFEIVGVVMIARVTEIRSDTELACFVPAQVSAADEH